MRQSEYLIGSANLILMNCPKQDDIRRKAPALPPISGSLGKQNRDAALRAPRADSLSRRRSCEEELTITSTALMSVGVLHNLRLFPNNHPDLSANPTQLTTRQSS